MTLNQVKQKMAERIGQLLAGSTLEDEVKQLILDNFEQLPEHLVVRLLDALESESDALRAVEFELKLFFDGQDKKWEELEEEQKVTAEKFLDNYLKKTEEGLRVEKAKETVAS